MDQDRLKALLDEASDHYNQGRFEEAIATWKQVIAVDPQNQKSKEGIRMASLLVSDWDESGSGQGASSAAPRPAARRQAATAAASGDAGADGSAELDLALQVGREALAGGRHMEAAEAARRALELDPGNMEACGILSLSADDETAAAPVRIDPVAGAAGAIHQETTLDRESMTLGVDDTNPQLAVTAPGPLAAAQADLSPEDLRRISVVLDEGQREFDAGHFQEAISVWSRVFVIDRSNTEAGLRIDRAKASLEQRTRDVDELYYKAVDAHDANRIEEAVDLFKRVLELTPHPEARAYLDEITAKAKGGAPPVQEFAIEPPEPPRPRHQEETAAMFPGDSVPLADVDGIVRRPALLKPGGASSGRSATQEFIDRPLGTKRGEAQGGGLRKLLIGATLAIVFGAAGFSAWLWFGSRTGEIAEAEATPAEPPRPPREKAPLPDAPPSDKGGSIEVVPGAAPKPGETPAEDPVAPPMPDAAPKPVDTVQAGLLAEEGRAHYEQGRWAEAALVLKKARDLNPTDFTTKDLLDKVMVHLEKQAHFEQEMQLAGTYFSELDFASALHKFYRLHQERPDMRVLEACIRNSWFNWGVTLLQAGAVVEAAEKFDEVLLLRPGDREAAGARELARRYNKRPRDASYNAFVGGLTMRQLDAQ